MAIASFCARLLMREGKRKAFSGKVLQLGNQEVWGTKESLEKIAKQENFNLSEARCDIGIGQSSFVNSPTISSEYFFQRLGFETVDALDQNAFENANIIHDLNILFEQNSKYINNYNFIYDGGTLEHVFNIPNVLENIFELLSVDGRIMHMSPAANWYNHGFYCFSSCFFEDFYSYNDFQIEECGIYKMFPWSERVLYTEGDKNSQFIKSLNPTTFNGASFGLNFIATKLSNSTGNQIPQQGYYSDKWAGKNEDRAGLVQGSTNLKSIYGKLTTIPIIRRLFIAMRNYYANSLVNWRCI